MAGVRENQPPLFTPTTEGGPDVGELQNEMIAELDAQEARLEEARRELTKAARNTANMRDLVLSAEPGPPVVDPGDPVVPTDPEPPVEPGDPTPPVSGPIAPDAKWFNSQPTGKSGPAGQMTYGTHTYWVNNTQPHQLRGDEAGLSGEWHGYVGTHPNGQSGTLWHANLYDVYGLIEGLKVNHYGDWVKGREGHGLYLRCVPWLDMTIQDYEAWYMGGQVIQTEWRLHETNLGALGGKTPGVLTMRRCRGYETGMIDQGNAARASWSFAINSTGQHIVLEDCSSIDYHSPGPHEGGFYVGYGKYAWPTPSLRVTRFDSFIRHGDRAGGFIEGVTGTALVEETPLRGAKDYLDVVEGVGRLVVRNMPQDTTVRIKGAGPDKHRAEKATIFVPKGTTLDRTL